MGDPGHCREMDDSPDDPGALLTLGAPPVSEERSGANPAAAPKLSLYI